MPTLRQIDSILVATVLLLTTWVLLTSGGTLLSLAADETPGSIKLDWHDEINRMDRVLNHLIPAGALLLVGHIAILWKTKNWGRSVLAYELTCFLSATFVAISVWSFIAKAHAPTIDLWRSIWWR
jgi:hypothetical protein